MAVLGLLNIKKITFICSLLLGVLCLAWCFNLRNPNLLFIRSYETWILVSVLLVLIGLTKFYDNYRFALPQIFVSVFLIVFLFVNKVGFIYSKSNILAEPSQDTLQINQRLIVGFDDFESVIPLVKNGIAGIFITGRNIEALSRDELSKKITALQTIRKGLGLPILHVTTDQEGGMVSRMSPLVDRQPPLKSIVSKSNVDELAFKYGYSQGQQLRDIGVNVNFSPVVDLMPSRRPSVLDFNTRIWSRAIAEDSAVVSQVAKAYISGLNASGVVGTLKHFPGLSSVDEDTHYFAASINSDIAEMEKTDWLPYKEIPKAVDTWIMLSHVILEQIDPLNPVSTSVKVVEDVLRDKLKFDGVIVTDDLTMGATFNRGFCKSVIGAYESDIDYLLISYDHEKYFDAVKCMLKTLR